MERGVDFTALVYDMSEEGLARINGFVDALEDILVYMGVSKVEFGGEPNTAITPEMIDSFVTEVEAYINQGDSATAGTAPTDEMFSEWL
jgi:hypothetical protein